MSATPTGKPKTKRGRGQTRLRRRIIDKDVEKSNSEEDENVPTPDQPVDSSDSTVEFEPERYNLRNRSGDVSLFYKSVLTPSRLKKRKSKGDHKSFYRTPKIKSTKKDYSIIINNKTPKLVKILWQEQIHNIINKPWKVCYLSTMMGFQFTKKNFKSAYIRTLKIRILDEYPSYHLTVTVTPSSFLYQNTKRSDSLFINVTSLSLSDETGEQVLRTIYDALLVRSKNTQSVSLPGTDWFPLMLFSGLDIVHNVVVRWLQASFGCYITPRGLNAASILWLSAVWTHGQCSSKHHKDVDERKVTFHYYAALVSDDPKYKTEKGLSLKMSLKARNVMHIWTKVMGKRSDRGLNSDDVASFHRKVECLLCYLTKIPKELISLQAVQTPCNSISKGGKIRITCQRSFLSLLQHLVESFENICHFQNLDQNPDNDDLEEEIDEVDEPEEEEDP